MNNKKTIYGIIFILICLVAIGYAAIVSNISIVGTAKIKTNNFDVHFENVSVTSGSVEINTTNGDSAATIEPTNRTRVDYSVTLANPGDFYEFTVKVVNGGGMDAMINTVTSKMNNVVINNNLPNYLEYNVTYEDGVAIEPNHELNATQVETYKVRVAYRTDIDPSDLPTTPSTLNFSFSVNYIQKDSNAITRPVLTFENSTWSEIANAIRSGYTDFLNVGDTKEVNLELFGTHTVRIANTSTPAECSTTGFSQTACGVVIEFADAVVYQKMNPKGEYKGTQYNTGWNVDGWPVTQARAYLNNGIYLPDDATRRVDYTNSGFLSLLPEDLRNSIIDTKVISGYGSTSGETNFESIDKIYLLSTHEVWEYAGGYNYEINLFDTAYYNTRQLDYYKNLGVTTSNYSGAIKKNGTSDSPWWLRNSVAMTTSSFFGVSDSGDWVGDAAYKIRGVSPAFRIG